jgi:serine/threonine-protein kinase
MKTCPTCQASYPNNYAICPADGNPLQEVSIWSDGSIIRGKYRLLAKVGQGGMGSVYKALHLAFDEMRALKVIAPELLTDELFVKRFKHEAVITRRLQHPNAVRVDDIDEAEDGRPYIVMEFIDGKSLKKLIREEGPLPFQRVLSIIKQAASALDAAHKLGMVHRDIKPDNIALVDAPEGEMVKVLDFGIAKVKEARMGEAANMTLTGAGVVIGTPQYMSPEQAMGKRGDELDGRADLYSLGVVMYQMLTADLPFRADTTMEMLLAHMQKPPAPIGVLHPELQVPENVAALAMRLLEKNRDMRPASALVLIQEIEKIEKDMLNPARTRVLTADDLVRASENRGPSGDRGGAAVPPPPRTQPPPVRPVEPPKPVPPPVIRQPQIVAPPLPRHKPPESRWGMWVALIVLLVGVGGGGLYIATRQPSPQPEPVPRPSPAPPNPAPVNPPSPTPGQNPPAEPVVSNPTPPPSPEPTVEPTRPNPKPKVPRKTDVPAPEPAPPAVEPRAIKAKITMGDFHLGRGEYDEAISSYQEGLSLDPSNAPLRKKLDGAIKTCKKESAVLNENLSCGGH